MLVLYRKYFKNFLLGDPVDRLKKLGLVVGHNFTMLEDVYIDPSHVWLISIGDDVTLAPRVQILAHDASTKRYLGKTRIGKVVVGNRVFIGASSVILPAVTIGSEVIIGAGSVITKDIPDGVVAAGNPARVITSLAKFLERKASEMNSSPKFDHRYTMGGNITMERKTEMMEKITNRIGYIV